MSTLHYLSLTTALTQVLDARGTTLSTATSFFYETSSSGLYLITNWHNVTGRNPEKPRKILTGAVPCFLRIRLHRKQQQEVGKPHFINISDIAEEDLPINSKNGDEPQWLEHPNHRFKVDVVGIPIADPVKFKEKYEINVANKWKEYLEDFEPEAMDDVFVVGYPWGLSSSRSRGDGLPIYKRGSIASDPIVDYFRLPCVLIDCRTTSGLSGSPVVASRSGIFMPDGKFSANTSIGTVSRFLGVYSGRLIGDEPTSEQGREISEIGMVWKASALQAIAEQGKSGTPLKELVG